MTVGEMRLAISKVYDGQKWKDKVRDMSDSQVTAIYHKMIGSGQIKQNRGPVYKVIG